MMTRGGACSSEEDLPSLDQLLAQRRVKASSRKMDSLAMAPPSSSLPLPSPSEPISTPSKPPMTTRQPPTTSHVATPRPVASLNKSPQPVRRSPRHSSSTPLQTPSSGQAKSKLSTTPSSEARHRALADELFPPSPPPDLVSTAPLANSTNLDSQHRRDRDRSPSIISDSEPDLPSPTKKSNKSFPASASSQVAKERKRSIESFWVEDSEEEREHEVAVEPKQT